MQKKISSNYLKQKTLESSKNYNLDLEEKIGETMMTPFMETKKKEEGNYQLTVYNDENFLECKRNMG